MAFNRNRRFKDCNKLCEARDDVNAEHISLMDCNQGGVVCAMNAAKLKSEIERKKIKPSISFNKQNRQFHSN